MILKRLYLKLKAQDYVAALIEVLIVIFGVVIALQLDQWYANNKNQRLELEYLQRFESELTAHITREQGGREWNKKRLMKAQVVMDALANAELSEEKITDFNAGLYLLGVINKPRLYWGVIDEMRASGNIGLFTDDKLKKAITSLENESKWRLKLVDDEANIIAPLRTKLIDYYEVLSMDGGDDPEIQLNKDIQSLAEDQMFKNYVHRIAAFQVFGNLMSERNFNQIESLREMVREQIKNHPKNN